MSYMLNDCLSDDANGEYCAAAFHAISCLEVYEPAMRACQGVLGPFRASFIHAVHVALGRAADSLEAELRQKDRLARNFYVMLNTGSYLSCAVLRFTAALSGKNEWVPALVQ